VKSGKNYTLSSLNQIRKKYTEQLNEAFVFHTSDLSEKEGITYLPVYMASCL
jgi:glucose dehydrogenase